MANQQAQMTMDMSFADILVDVVDADIKQPSLDQTANNRLTLRLTDFMQDTNGEIVLFNDSHVPRLALATDIIAVDRGEIGRHVTASGDDVSGFHFISFGNGMKVYYQDGLDLVVINDETLV